MSGSFCPPMSGCGRPRAAISPGAHGGTVSPLDEHAEDLLEPNRAPRGLRAVEPEIPEPEVAEPEVVEPPVAAKPEPAPQPEPAARAEEPKPAPAPKPKPRSKK